MLVSVCAECIHFSPKKKRVEICITYCASFHSLLFFSDCSRTILGFQIGVLVRENVRTISGNINIIMMLRGGVGNSGN